MPADPRRVKDLFVAALDLPDTAAREAFLDRECVGDGELRHRLGVLLRAHVDPASVLSRPLVAVVPSDPVETASEGGDVSPTAAPADDSAGALVADRYRLVELIGQGGMGTVWTGLR